MLAAPLPAGLYVLATPIVTLGDISRRALDVLRRAGRIACEWYGNGGAPDRPAAAFSISKTVLSLLLAQPDIGQAIVVTAIWFTQWFLAGQCRHPTSIVQNRGESRRLARFVDDARRLARSIVQMSPPS